MSNWPQSEMNGRNRKYHLEMTLGTLRKMRPEGGDTRSYLDLDEPERLLMIELIEKELSIETKAGNS